MAENNTRVFLRGISVTTVFTVASGVLGLVYFSVMSRLLTKEDFGYFAAVTGIVAIVACFSDAGLGSAVVQKKEATKGFISTAFSLSLVFGASCMLLVACFAPFIANLVADDYLTKPLRLMSITLLLNSFVSVGNAQLYRNLKFARIGTISFTSNLLTTAISIFMAYKGFGLYSMIAYVVLLPFFTVLLIYTTSVKIPKFRLEKSYIKGIVSFGGWLTLSGILNKMSTLIDRLVLPKLASIKVLGAYTRPASFVTNISGQITDIFDKVLFPMLSKIQDDKESARSIFYRAIELLNTFSVILAVLFFFNAELIMSIFFGKEWTSLTYVLQILSLTMIFQIDSQLADCFFRSLNLVKKGFYLRAFALIWTLTCVVIGARSDIIGIAVSLTFADISITILRIVVLGNNIQANYYSMLGYWLKAWKPAIIPILVGVIFIFVPASLTNQIIKVIGMALVVIVEFGLFPGFVGNEYKKLAEPILEKIRIRIK